MNMYRSITQIVLVIALACGAIHMSRSAVAASSAAIEVADNSSMQPFMLWTRIAPMDLHSHQVIAAGWTIVSVQAAEAAPIDVIILDRRGNSLGSFDSNGCGALFYFDQPTAITVLLHNRNRITQDYQLHVL